MKVLLFLSLFLSGIFNYDITTVDNKLVEYSMLRVLNYGTINDKIEWQNNYSGNSGYAMIIEDVIDNNGVYSRQCKTVLLSISNKDNVYESAVSGCYDEKAGVWRMEKYKQNPNNPKFNGKIEDGEDLNGPSY